MKFYLKGTVKLLENACKQFVAFCQVYLSSLRTNAYQTQQYLFRSELTSIHSPTPKPPQAHNLGPHLVERRTRRQGSDVTPRPVRRRVISAARAPFTDIFPPRGHWTFVHINVRT